MQKHVLIAGSPSRSKNYENALSVCGFQYTVTLSSKSLSKYNMLLLPGGGDLPSLLTKINQPEDFLQLSLLHEFIVSERPVLGICKGMQLINLYFNGTLYPDLMNPIHHSYDSANKTDRYHNSLSLPNTYLYTLYGDSFWINSAHHQGCAMLGVSLLPAQYSDDSALEGFYHAHLPVFGVQWHPERLLQSDFPLSIDGKRLFQYVGSFY